VRDRRADAALQYGREARDRRCRYHQRLA